MMTITLKSKEFVEKEMWRDRLGQGPGHTPYSKMRTAIGANQHLQMKVDITNQRIREVAQIFSCLNLFLWPTQEQNL